MTTPNLNVADLLARYLERQTESASQGLGFADLGEATPYDATPIEAVASIATAGSSCSPVGPSRDCASSAS